MVDMLSRQPQHLDYGLTMGKHSQMDPCTVSPSLSLWRYKVWHFSGSQLSEVTVNSPSELWEVTWLPQVAGGYDTPDPTEVLLGQTHQKTPCKWVYRHCTMSYL